MRSDPKVIFTVLWVVFFFQGMTPGFWVPALTNILRARGLGDWVPAVFVVPPICALISPLIGGALADQRVAADRLLAWSSVICSVVLVAAFACLDAGWHPAWFVGLLGLYSLFSGPTWGLLATISLTGLAHGERQFPLVRHQQKGVIHAYVALLELPAAESVLKEDSAEAIERGLRSWFAGEGEMGAEDVAGVLSLLIYNSHLVDLGEAKCAVIESMVQMVEAVRAPGL